MLEPLTIAVQLFWALSLIYIHFDTLIPKGNETPASLKLLM